MRKLLDGKRVLITGGTGSLGKVLIRRLLSGEVGVPERIVVLSRDEAKQHYMRLEYENGRAATDEIIYHNFERLLTFRIGDVRDFASISSALREIDVVVNAAALKQVPTCEYFPFEAVRTNIVGAENIVRSIEQHRLSVSSVVCVSTDKACKPVNTMGMTKALQERIFIQANLRAPWTRFVCVRYGNVLASRGSVVPLFHDQIRRGGPVTITTVEMTRFLLSLDDAVDTIFAALARAEPGETWVPIAPAARVVDIAQALIGDLPVATTVVGIRPGEKIHEIMVSDEEAHRTVSRDRWLTIRPMLPELIGDGRAIEPPCLGAEYSSSTNVMPFEKTKQLLEERYLMLRDVVGERGEILR